MATTEPRTNQDHKLTLWQRIRLAFARSWLAHFFLDTSCLQEDREKSSVFSRFFRYITEKTSFKKSKLFLVRQVEQNRILRLISRFMASLFHTPLRSFGMFFLAFGVFLVTASLISPAKYQTETQVLTWAIAAVLVLCALLLLFSQKTLAETIRDSRFCSAVIFKILGSRQNTIDQEISVRTSDALAFVCGIVFALPTLFLPTPTVLLIYTLTVLGYLTLLTPESGLVLLLFLIPFCTNEFLFYSLAFILLTFLCKVLLGRRTIHFNRMDYPITLFLLALLICGSVSARPIDSIKTSLFYAFLLCGYFLITNLIKAAPWLHRCIFALSLSAFVTAFYEIVRYFLGKASERWPHQDILSTLSGRLHSTFSTPSALAQYLVLVLPLLFSLFLLQLKESKKRPWAIAAFLIVCVSLVLTWTEGAWLAALVACALLCLFAGKHCRIFLCSLVLAFSISLPFLPKVFLTHLTSIFSLSDSLSPYRLRIFQSSIDNLRHFWHTGIGLGDEAFSSYYAHIFPIGSEATSHSHQLFLQIWVCLGIIGFLLFAWLLIYFFRIFTLLQKSLTKTPHEQTRLISLAFFCSLCALLVFGLTDYVFYEPRIFFLFFGIGALLVSMQRVYYQEYHRPHHSHSTFSAYTIDLPHKKPSRRTQK